MPAQWRRHPRKQSLTIVEQVPPSNDEPLYNFMVVGLQELDSVRARELNWKTEIEFRIPCTFGHDWMAVRLIGGLPISISIAFGLIACMCESSFASSNPFNANMDSYQCHSPQDGDAASWWRTHNTLAEFLRYTCRAHNQVIAVT